MSETPPPLSRRSYLRALEAASWEEIWEAGNYYDRVSELMEGAREWIILVGWQIDSRLLLRAPDGGWEKLKSKLIRLCRQKPDLRIYLLIWDHSYFYVLERERFQGRIWDGLPPRIHFVFDNRHPLGASHHEKICLIDDHVALCGGIDLCDERWDSPSHLLRDPRRSLTRRSDRHGPYHDFSVQVTGEICGELRRHVARRWRRISTVPFPEARSPRHSRPRGGHRVYLSRTMPGIDFAPGDRRVVREIEFLYRELVAHARRRLILEGQYYWSEEFNDLLIAKFREMRGTGFEVILILADLARAKSLTRLMTAYELGLLERLELAARQCGVRLVLGTPYSYPAEGGAAKARPVYVHSKVVIVDDAFLSIGSANFAARALRLDTELNLTLEGRTPAERLHIRRFADGLLAHWNLRERHGPSNPGRSVELRPLKPALRREALGAGLGWFPWRGFFDPRISWLYPLKRRLHRRLRSRRARLACLALGLPLGALVTLALSSNLGLPTRALGWAAAYGALLSSAWALPIPYLPLSVLASLHLGSAGIRLSVAALWVAAAAGYVQTRMFPGAARRLLRLGRGRGPRRGAERRFGARTFTAVLKAAFDPRISLRRKIACQGLFCVPGPWFALIDGVLLPAALYGFLKLAARAWVEIR